MIVSKHISLVRLFKVIWKRLLMIVVVASSTVLPLIYFELTRYAIDRSIPLVVGTAIAIFLGFRTNSAYERWCEAREAWGRMVVDSLNFVRLCKSMFGTDDRSAREVVKDFEDGEAEHAVKAIASRQIAWAYVLNRQLKDDLPSKQINNLLSSQELEQVEKSRDPGLFLLNQQSDSLRHAFDVGIIDTYQHIFIQEKLSDLVSHMGVCHRIRNTVFPVHYSYFTKVFIWIFLVLLGFSLPSYEGFAVDSEQAASYIAIPAIIVIGWVFFMVDGIGDYMQAPFENNRNVIPMDSLAREIEIGVRLTLGETDLPGRRRPVDGALT